MRFLLFFLDGIGLGNNDTSINPFAIASMPRLRSLLDGHRLTADIPFPLVSQNATLAALDACLGVEGLPQSATGQASLLTGKNVPALLGYHYGPKPNGEIAACLSNNNLFITLNKKGINVGFLNAYPQPYFDGIASGHRIPGAIAMAANQADVHLMTADDLYNGDAISADLTGQGWREHLGYCDAPLLSPAQAGEQLARLSKRYEFSLFEYWLSDIAGHKQDMQHACKLLETLDQTIGGLSDAWDGKGLVIVVSDHGNLEDLGTRRHTLNPVPLLLIGDAGLRRQFINNLGIQPPISYDLTNVYKMIVDAFTTTTSPEPMG